MPAAGPPILAQGRESFQREAWADAHAQLSAADRESPLPPDDLERLAMAAALIGREEESADLLARTHQDYLRAGQPNSAARCAAYLTLNLLTRGEAARAGGWLARAQRLLEPDRSDTIERAYLLIPVALQHLYQGDAPTAYDSFSRAAAIAHRVGDLDVAALAQLGQGQALVAMGRVAEGMTHLDEAMVAVTAGEVSPIFTGVIYCAVVASCWLTFDLRRAREWTDALSAWCGAHPDLVLFRGECLVHRAELMRLHGAWPDALLEVERARRLVANPQDSTHAEALYEQGEIHRLRGEIDLAAGAYRLANQAGRSPQPGLALLRLAQGDVPAATAAIRRELEETEIPLHRARLLPAFVEIMLAAGDVPAARTAAEELARTAARLRSPYLDAIAAHAGGAVLLASDDPRAALAALRRASAAWHDLDAPYEAARARLLIATACRQLGDHDTASLELDAARATFQRLGATLDLNALPTLQPAAAGPSTAGAGPLTPRELEVLRLVAAGHSNRAIAAALVLSEKTVARHVANIFTKLSLTSRAAATAYAYQHQLV